MKAILILCLLVVYTAAQSCTTNANGLCQTCTLSTASNCGGQTFAGPTSCLGVSSIPSDNPCGFTSSSKICAAGANLNGTVNVAGYTQANANTANQACINASGAGITNSACCSATLACPTSCSSTPTTTTYTYSQPAPNILLCYDVCPRCNGLGLSNTYCTNNCGKTGFSWNCNGNGTCCEIGSASSKFNFISALKYYLGF